MKLGYVVGGLIGLVTLGIGASAVIGSTGFSQRAATISATDWAEIKNAQSELTGETYTLDVCLPQDTGVSGPDGYNTCSFTRTQTALGLTRSTGLDMECSSNWQINAKLMQGGCKRKNVRTIDSQGNLSF